LDSPSQAVRLWFAGGHLNTMSLKCSFLGHRYGQTEVERERTEEGSEVIITVREIKQCKRCGDERIVSENKEVTTLETAAEIVADDLEKEEVASEQQSGSSTPAGQADDENPPATTVTGGADGQSDSVTGTTPEAVTDDVIEAGEDDAVILDDDDGEDDEREPGEWPKEAESEEQRQTQSDAAGTEPDTGSAAWPEDTEPQTTEWPEETERQIDESRDPGEWPEEPAPDDDRNEWESLTKPEPRPLDDPAVEPTKSAVSVPDGMFRCSQCEYSTPVEESPLRAGDFCPECRVGSLEHHTE